MAAVEKGLRVVRDTGEIATGSFLHFAQGELKRRRWETGEAEAHDVEASHRRAIDSARAVGAPTQAVAPATRLAALWREIGRGEESVALLEEALRPFDPALDVPVLRRARSELALGRGGA